MESVAVCERGILNLVGRVIDRKRRSLIAFALMALSVCGPCAAESIVLVQGFAGSGDDWRTSGVALALSDGGWRDGGHLRLTGNGVEVERAQDDGGQRFFTVAIPSTTGLLDQARVLEHYIAFVRDRFPSESMTVVGHSAGGVLARYCMVDKPELGIDSLVTIASPHLGSQLAKVEKELDESPFGVLVGMLAGTELHDALKLVRDLAEEEPGNFLYELNRRDHPQARYVSVVREMQGVEDLIIPARNQDMADVTALRGRVRTLTTRGAHGIAKEDGQLLLEILDTLRLI